MGRYGGLSFEDAMTLYADTVKRIALLRMQNEQDARDIFQTVFLKLYTCKKAFSDKEQLRAWLITVTIHACIDEQRRFWRRHQVAYEESLACVKEHKDRQLITYLMQLPHAQRDVLYLHYYEGYTVAEIGKLLHAKENTVKSWLKRGREGMKELLGGEIS